jgi:hypothetical protein
MKTLFPLWTNALVALVALSPLLLAALIALAR